MKLPVDPSNLRDHAVPARVERVWERLEGNLTGELGRPRSESPRRRTALYVAAALAAGFGAGVTVATRTSGPLATTPQAERPFAVATTERVASEATSPAGSHEDDGKGERVVTTDGSALPKTAAPPSVGPRRRDGESTTPTPAWVLACANDEYDKAFELLEASGGVADALQHATNEQRLCLASGSRQKNQADVAKLALQNVADDSGDPDRAAIAAAQLARIYEDEGNVSEQRRYEQLKEIRSKGRLLSEGALCEKIQVQAGVGAHRTVLELARQYQNQYPSGTCADTVQALEATAKAKLDAAAGDAHAAGHDD